MLKKISVITLSVSLVFALLSWGNFGHEHINRAAVFALPKPIQTFFYNHIDFITQEATIPDLRKYTLKDNAEKPRHFIDIEFFGTIDSIPKNYDLAKKKYTADFISKNGLLPWYIDEVMEKLTKAFKEKRKTEILFLAADLAHYLGDAHMPLHTSSNHDGQLTDQKGIHALWESQIPELFGENYNFNTNEAHYIDNIEKETWTIISNSHQLSFEVLSIDKQLRQSFPADKIFEKDSDGKVLKNKFHDMVFSKEYIQKFNELLKGMVEKQMNKSIQATANYWFTAWVNAGKPDLSTLDTNELTKRNAPLLIEDLKLWKQGKLSGIQTEKEF